MCYHQEFMTEFIIFIVLSAMLSSHSSLASDFEVRAHRGGRENAPENIIPAFIAGIKNGSDSIELDIHFTRDQQIVVSHDSDLARQCVTLDGQKILHVKPILQMSLKEVQQFDCGSVHDPEFPNQVLSPGAKIPTLNDVLDLLEDKGLANSGKVKVAIEIKIWPGHPELTPPRNQIVSLLTKLLEKRKIESRVVIISFDPIVLQMIKKQSPALAIQLLVAPQSAGLLLDWANPNLKPELQIDAILPYWEMLNSNIIKALHNQGNKVIPWTPNKKNIWKNLIDNGVDGITTDDPKGLLDVL
jgi:glycerophosphoryl diester phosphodiesterase